MHKFSRLDNRLFRDKTAQQVHAELAFPAHARCHGCGGPPINRAIVMAPLDELRRRGQIPEHVRLSDPALMSVIIPIRESADTTKLYVRMSCVYSCLTCAAELEKALAKTPSWCIVEINRGPNPKNSVQLAMA